MRRVSMPLLAVSALSDSAQPAQFSVLTVDVMLLPTTSTMYLNSQAEAKFHVEKVNNWNGNVVIQNMFNIQSLMKSRKINLSAEGR